MNFTNTISVGKDWGEHLVASQADVSVQLWNQVFGKLYRIINKITQEINK